MIDVQRCSLQVIGSQKAYLSSKALRKYALKSGQSVFIDTTTSKQSKTTASLCRIWPSDDIKTDDKVLADECVSSDLKENNFFTHSDGIRIANKVNLDKIEVHVVFNKHISLCQSVDGRNGHNKSLSRKVRSLLEPLSLASGFTYKCLNSKLGAHFDISSVTIHFKNQNRYDYCELSPITVVEIVSFTSQQLIDQHDNFASTIAYGTFDLDLDTLISLSNNAYKGILISGPSGIGKTSLVERVCLKRKAFLLRIDSSDLCRTEVGEAEHFLDTVYTEAELFGHHGDVIIFIKDIDIVFKKGEQGMTNSKRRLMTHLCRLIEATRTSHCSGDVVTIATSCKARDVNEALRNCGRLEKNITLGISRDDDRLSLLHHFSRGYSFPKTTSTLLRQLNAFTPADISKFCSEAISSSRADNSLPEVNEGHLHSALTRVTPSALRNSDVTVGQRSDNTNLDDIGGLQKVKAEMKKCIEWPLKHSFHFSRLGLKPTSGVLLYGPPGCAKTALVRAFAKHCCVSFLSLSGAQLFSSYVGDSEKKIAEAFSQARSAAPSILFIDEIDSVLTKRGQGQEGSGVQERVLSTLLNEMDGLVSTTPHNGQASEIPLGVLVVAATNRPNNLDDAILRPGRFDRIIHVPIPDVEARECILRIYSKQMNLDPKLVDFIVERTNNYTGADLENLCREVIKERRAALMALTSEGMTCTKVTQSHFEEALKIGPSLSNEDIINYSIFR